MGVATFDRRTGGELGGRYRVDAVHPGDSVDSSFEATHLPTGRRVRLVEVSAEVASGWHLAVELANPHLATLREVIALADGRAVLVQDWVAGPDLQRVLSDHDPLAPLVAIELVLALAGAVTTLHQSGAVHGLIRPTAVISAEGRGPVLGAAPAAPTDDPYRAPERAVGRPSAADDLWSLAALLHRAASGVEPPTQGYPSPDQEARIGHLGPLGAWLRLALGPKSQRPPTIEALTRSLVECRRAVSLATATAARAAVPAPAGPPDAAQADEPGEPLGEPRRGPWQRVGAVLLFVAIAGVVAVVVASTGRPAVPARSPASAASPPRSAPPVATPPAAAGARSASSSDPVDGAGSAHEAGVALPPGLSDADAERVRCVARQLPEGAWRRPVDLGALCSTSDPRQGSRLLRSAVVAAGGGSDATPAARLWARLGSFGMAGFAVVRAACCPGAAPLELPAPAGCDPPAAILSDLAGAAAAAGSLENPLSRYQRCLRCQWAQGHGGTFELTGPPRAADEAAFRQLVEARRGP